MCQQQLSDLFNSLGICPNRKGYPFLLHLVELSASYKGQSFPCMKDLYQQTAEHFGVMPDIIEYNVRTVVRVYWSQKESARIFSSITHYPVTDELTVKEFISVLAEYAARHF